MTMAANLHNNAMLSTNSRSPTEPDKPKLFQQIIGFLSGMRAGQAKGTLSPTMQQVISDPPPTPLHQKLYIPDEKEEEARQRAGYPHSAAQEPIRRIMDGPFPQRKVTDSPIIQSHPALTSLAHEAGLAFLTPIESDVLSIMLQTKRCARFRPILSPHAELLLVQPSDLLSLRHVQEVVEDLPDFEKELLENDLQIYLLQQQRYVLGLLLWNSKIRVTTTGSKGMVEMEVQEHFYRPDSADFFGPWRRREWDDEPDPKAGFRIMGSVDE